MRDADSRILRSLMIIRFYKHIKLSDIKQLLIDANTLYGFPATVYSKVLDYIYYDNEKNVIYTLFEEEENNYLQSLIECTYPDAIESFFMYNYLNEGIVMFNDIEFNRLLNAFYQDLIDSNMILDRMNLAKINFNELTEIEKDVLKRKRHYLMTSEEFSSSRNAIKLDIISTEIRTGYIIKDDDLTQELVDNVNLLNHELYFGLGHFSIINRNRDPKLEHEFNNRNVDFTFYHLDNQDTFIATYNKSFTFELADRIYVSLR